MCFKLICFVYYSYPALLVMPMGVTDDSIRRFCRCYRHGRIPSITWRHPRTRALLVRGAGYHGKGVMGMLKSHPSSTGKKNKHIIICNIL
jgi:myotubularin-related protein 5/13